MLIEICSKNYTYKMVDNQILDALIKNDEIIAFKRSEGWAIIGEDKLRESSRKLYESERRTEVTRERYPSAL